MARLHPRVAISGLCFPDLSAADSIGVIAEIGAGATSMTSSALLESGVDNVVKAGREHGVDVVTTTGLLRFDLRPGADVGPQLQRMHEDIDQAVAVGARTVYTLTGPRVFDEWDDNLEAYVRLIEPVVEYAAERGIGLALEPANWLYADFSFVHSFRDALALGSAAGMGVCLDSFHVWTERDLHLDISAHIDLISHVQLSDQDRGARSLPCRAIPGAGDVPNRAIVRWLLDAGYAGPFDLELSGPTIDALGHREAAGEAARWLSELLTELGA